MNYCDWINIIVAILCGLCTVLVGWQLFNIIKLNNIDKRFNDLEESISKSKLDVKKEMCELVAERALIDAAEYVGKFQETNNNIERLGVAYYLCIRAIKNLIACGKTNEIKEAIPIMKKCVFLTHINNAWDKVFTAKSESQANIDYAYIEIYYNPISESQKDDIRNIKQWIIRKDIPQQDLNEIKSLFKTDTDN